jgi:hypothetical protein
VCSCVQLCARGPFEKKIEPSGVRRPSLKISETFFPTALSSALPRVVALHLAHLLPATSELPHMRSAGRSSSGARQGGGGTGGREGERERESSSLTAWPRPPASPRAATGKILRHGRSCSGGCALRREATAGRNQGRKGREREEESPRATSSRRRRRAGRRTRRPWPWLGEGGRRRGHGSGRRSPRRGARESGERRQGSVRVGRRRRPRPP